ncbi:MAG: pyridoxamine 5'-phosphate oxidase family protein [Halobacteriales archaeon]
MGIELDAEERWDVLERNMVMRLATVDPDGYPHVTPIWYVADREYGNVYFSTPEDTRKVRDVEAFPKASLTVDEGAYYFDLVAVIVEGTVSFVEPGEERATVEEAWCRKYFDQPERPEFMDLLYQGRPWEWYRVEPSRWISWDNSNIDLDRLRAQRG